MLGTFAQRAKELVPIMRSVGLLLALSGGGGCSNGHIDGAGLPSGGSSAGSAGSSAGSAASSAGGTTACVIADPVASPVRRLTRLEYDNTVRDLLGLDLSLAAGFPTDAIAGGFSNNASVLSVSALLAEKYMAAAETLAAEAIMNLATLLPCDPAATGEDACARAFIETFGRRAYRRPLAAADSDQRPSSRRSFFRNSSLNSKLEFPCGRAAPVAVCHRPRSL